MKQFLTYDEARRQRVVLLLEYFGPAYAGCQLQKNAYTVQEALEEALRSLNVSFLPGSVSFSGRTDRGVHAKGQVVHFDIYGHEALREIPDFLQGINAVLPPTISVKDYAITDDFNFHATCSAQWRWYRYKIYNKPLRSVWMDPDSVWIKHLLNVSSMQEGARFLLGEKDFTSFRSSGSAVTSSICHVIHSEIHEDGDYILFDIVANRFIYKMVRNIMGILIKIGTDSSRTKRARAVFTPDDIPVILSRKDRQSAGPAAKPQGLSMMAVYYPCKWDFFSENIYVKKLGQRLRLFFEGGSTPPPP